ncbi:uncharacterized protein PV07_07693 [Cladophialophora immunda]|uniref:Uncharacterized protein n=1 Tax=Cladophialophora immunda TaxID=569365 RepID=A0A0D1ZJ89_9EURO|nr:uncharacterized protein PV07_07693 [Cladophialophora immunda]KIW28001.1 hypothetical protein PV07_07693 [Cladophialophora immunda]
MAQGQIKKGPKPSSTKLSNSGGITKKGSRTITPKKAKLLKQAKLNKKYTAGLTAKTEAMLGARAGHLEMLGQAKKKDGAAAANSKAKEAMCPITLATTLVEAKTIPFCLRAQHPQRLPAKEGVQLYTRILVVMTGRGFGQTKPPMIMLDTFRLKPSKTSNADPGI